MALWCWCLRSTIDYALIYKGCITKGYKQCDSKTSSWSHTLEDYVALGWGWLPAEPKTIGWESWNLQPYPLPLGKDKMLEIELMPAVSEQVSRDSMKKLNNGIQRASKWAFREAEKGDQYSTGICTVYLFHLAAVIVSFMIVWQWGPERQLLAW